MFIKVMRSGAKSEWRKDELPLSFDRIVVSKITDMAGRDVGRNVLLLFSDDPNRDGVLVQLPHDGDTVYLEDNDGNTTDRVQWFAPRARNNGGRELRVTGEAIR